MPSDLRRCVTMNHRLPADLSPNGIFQGHPYMEPVTWTRLGTMTTSTAAHNIAFTLARDVAHQNQNVPKDHRGYNDSLWGYTDHLGKFFIIGADRLTVQIKRAT